MTRLPIARRALLSGGAALALLGLRSVAQASAKPEVTVYWDTG